MTTAPSTAATPTDAERELAADLIDRMDRMGPAMRYRTLAQALADQRRQWANAVAEAMRDGDQALADQRARYEGWLVGLHQIDDNGYCIECERPAPNGCTTLLELPRILQASR